MLPFFLRRMRFPFLQDTCNCRFLVLGLILLSSVPPSGLLVIMATRSARVRVYSDENAPGGQRATGFSAHSGGGKGQSAAARRGLAELSRNSHNISKKNNSPDNSADLHKPVAPVLKAGTAASAAAAVAPAAAQKAPPKAKPKAAKRIPLTNDDLEYIADFTPLARPGAGDPR